MIGPYRRYPSSYAPKRRAPLPDPVADLTFHPANPTTADELICRSASNVGPEDIQRHTWQRLQPGGANSYDVEWNMGQMPAGPVVVMLTITLHDGRTSAGRQRAVTVTPA
jgi:hypothetical protein